MYNRGIFVKSPLFLTFEVSPLFFHKMMISEIKNIRIWLNDISSLVSIVSLLYRNINEICALAFCEWADMLPIPPSLISRFVFPAPIHAFLLWPWVHKIYCLQNAVAGLIFYQNQCLIHQFKALLVYLQWQVIVSFLISSIMYQNGCEHGRFSQFSLFDRFW